MQFGLSSVIRGSGKVYAVLNVPGLEACPESLGRLSVVSTGPLGQRLPARVVLHEGAFVLVTQVTDCDQDIKVEVRGADGTAGLSDSIVLSAKKTAFEAKKNSFLKDASATGLRGCDDAASPFEARMRVNRNVMDVNETDIMQGTLTLPLLMDQDAEKCQVEVYATNRAGEHIELAGWVCTRDEVRSDRDYPSIRERVVDFSVRIPRIEAYGLCARFEGCSLHDCFMWVDEGLAAGWRDGWIRTALSASEDWNYGDWFRTRHQSVDRELAVQRAVQPVARTVFSLVMTLGVGEPDLLRSSYGSLCSQTYDGWELVLVGTSQTPAGLLAAAKELVSEDGRVSLVDAVAACPELSGFAAAQGDFVGLFDLGDVLEPDLLWWYAREAFDHKDVDLIYCDEDKFDGDSAGNLSALRSPLLKPDWNQEFLLGMNYVGHLLAVRRELALGVEPAPATGSEAFAWHLALCAGEAARCVRHVPRVLYHARAAAGGAGPDAASRVESGKPVIAAHLRRVGIEGSVEESPVAPGRLRVRYSLGKRPLVSIIVPNKDAADMLGRCVESVRRLTTYPNWELIVVENNSVDPATFELYEAIQAEDPRVKVETLTGMTSFNFSRIVNFGAERSHGDYLLLLNNDTEVITPEWIEELLSPCMLPGVGATGAKLYYPDDTVQHAGVTHSTWGPHHLGYSQPRGCHGNNERLVLARDVSMVTGACLLTSRADYEELGGFDEGLAVAFNDCDYCLRLKKSGKRVLFVPTAELYHYESVSRGEDKFGEKALRFRRERGTMMVRWPEVYETCDPSESPLLEVDNPYEHLRWSLPEKIR